MDVVYQVTCNGKTKTYDDIRLAFAAIFPYLPWTISILDAQTHDEIASYDNMDAFFEFKTYLCNAVKDM